MPKIETEVRYRVKKDELSDIEFRKIDSCTQTDHYFSPPDRRFDEDEVNYLRVRISERGDSFDRHIVRNDEETEEYEVDIDDGENMVEILETLGFGNYVTVTKHRQIFDAGDFKVVLDSVEDLGTFIEIETMGELDRSRLEEITEELGLDNKDRVIGKGYPDMMLEKLDG